MKIKGQSFLHTERTTLWGATSSSLSKLTDVWKKCSAAIFMVDEEVEQAISKQSILLAWLVYCSTVKMETV
jgi:hypothetical protein